MRDSGHDSGAHAFSTAFLPWVIKSRRFLDDRTRP